MMETTGHRANEHIGEALRELARQLRQAPESIPTATLDGTAATMVRAADRIASLEKLLENTGGALLRAEHRNARLQLALNNLVAAIDMDIGNPRLAFDKWGGLRSLAVAYDRAVETLDNPSALLPAPEVK